MAYISRALQKVFGASGGIGEFGKFGSEALGSPEYSKDPEEIQSLSPYNNGWYAATGSGDEPPRIQDINAMFFLFSRQLAYILQAGVAEWDDGTEYFEGKSYVLGSDGSLYYSIQGDDITPNLNKNPTTETLWWKKVVTENGEAVSVDSSFMLDFVHPVGSFYVQYPDDESNDDAVEFPTTQRPSALFGGTWSEQWPTESIYFRTRGANSDIGRVDGLQVDQGQKITGSISTTRAVALFDAVAEGAGALSVINASKRRKEGDVQGTLADSIAFDSSGSPNARTSATTSGETRVTNRRIKVWKRTA